MDCRTRGATSASMTMLALGTRIFLWRRSTNAACFTLPLKRRGRESFGETVARAVAAADARLTKIPASKGKTRIEELCERYLGARPLDADVAGLRYQLLTATAGAVRHALRSAAGRTVLLVHEFVRAPGTHHAYAANSKDLSLFVARLTRGRIHQVPLGRLIEVPLPNAVTLGEPLRFFVGKASRMLSSRDSEPPPDGAAPT